VKVPNLQYWDFELLIQRAFASCAGLWLTAAITMRLLQSSFPIATGIVGHNITISWPGATRSGDVLHVDRQIEEIKLSRS
jgi:hypothetical protein